MLKTGVNRARFNLRQGLLSQGGTDALRAKGMLPSTTAYAAGLNKGTDRIYDHLNKTYFKDKQVTQPITETVSKPGILGRTLNLVSGALTGNKRTVNIPYKAKSNFYRNTSTESIFGVPITIRGPLELESAAISSYPVNAGVLKKLGLPGSSADEFAASNRRHEANELRTILANLRAKRSPYADRFASHAGKQVLREDSKDLMGLSKPVQDTHLRMRGAPVLWRNPKTKSTKLTTELRELGPVPGLFGAPEADKMRVGLPRVFVGSRF